MARVLGIQAVPRKRGKYPWDKWTDGQVWLLERGKDYFVPDLNMQSQAHQHARTHGMRVSTSMREEGVVVHFTKPAVKKPLRKKK